MKVTLELAARLHDGLPRIITRATTTITTAEAAAAAASKVQHQISLIIIV